MQKKLIEQYAEIVIKKGICLYQGQCLNITTSLAAYDFALVLAEKAYKNGAKYVEIVPVSNKLLNIRLQNAKNGDLSYIPDFKKSFFNESLAHDWAYIRIDNTEELDELQNADEKKLEMIIRAERNAQARLRNELMMDKHTWCVINYPGPNWARKIFPDYPEDKALEKLENLMERILRLDKNYPISAWEEQSQLLSNRCEKLNDLNFARLHFRTKDTDLEVGLNKTSRWLGGPCITPDNRVFLPNIPTEEIFTTPDWLLTNGYVKVIRPVKVMETLVKGAWFEFKDGKVIDSKAEQGENVLKSYLNMDEGASYLGEIALVDNSSPIAQCNTFFNSILYDENAACHFALGGGYPVCLENYQSLNSEQDKKKAGCNVSLVHTDFMINNNQLEIMGTTFSGKEVLIMQNGKFVL